MIKVVIENREFELPITLEKVKEIVEKIAIKMIEKYSSNGNYKKYNYATAILDSLDYLDETIYLNLDIPSHKQVYKMIKKKKKKTN
jgi:hypothetical protein